MKPPSKRNEITFHVLNTPPPKRKKWEAVIDAILALKPNQCVLIDLPEEDTVVFRSTLYQMAKRRGCRISTKVLPEGFYAWKS